MAPPPAPSAPTTPVPAAAPPEPTADPHARDWDDDPRTCARYDRLYWLDRDEDS